MWKLFIFNRVSALSWSDFKEHLKKHNLIKSGALLPVLVCRLSERAALPWLSCGWQLGTRDHQLQEPDLFERGKNNTHTPLMLNDGTCWARWKRKGKRLISRRKSSALKNLRNTLLTRRERIKVCFFFLCVPCVITWEWSTKAGYHFCTAHNNSCGKWVLPLWGKEKSSMVHR